MSARSRCGLTGWPTGLVAVAAAIALCGLCCDSSNASVSDTDTDDADAQVDCSDVADVEVLPDAGFDGDEAESGIGPDAESDLDIEPPDHPETDAEEIPFDGSPDVPDAWDVTPFVPEALDCTGRNACYVALADGGVGCELPDYVEPSVSCEVNFKVREFGRPGIDWDSPVEPEGEPLAGRTLARDGTEAIALVTWYDALSYSMEDWAAECLGHCPYYIFLTGIGGYYLIHVPTGTLVAATARPEVPFNGIPDIPPEYEIDGMTPEGELTGWYYRDSPEFDVRYMWRMEGVELPFTYEGPVIPGVVHRRRISTGEELPPIDLPLLL